MGFDVRSCTIVDRGAPTDLYYLHGFRSNRRAEHWLLEPFRNDPRMNFIACDARGHGHNRHSTETDWLGTVQDYEELLHRRQHPAILIGHSMGATEAVTLGLRNPQVKQVFAIDGIYGPDFVTPDKQKQLTRLFHLSARDAAQITAAFPQINNPCNDTCPDSLTRKFFSIHAQGDNLIPFQQAMEMQHALHLPSDHILTLSNPTGIKTLAAHILPGLNRSVKEFIQARISPDFD